MENDKSNKLHECATAGCTKPVMLGLFCSIECACEYGAYDLKKGWIIEDKVLDSIVREEYNGDMKGKQI